MPFQSLTPIRGVIIPERLTAKRKFGTDLIKEYSPIYSEWEIERKFSILEEISHSENIRYTPGRSYDTAIGLKIIACNLMVISNTETGNKPREIKKIVIC